MLISSRMEMEVIENMWWHLQSILYLLTSQNNVGQMGAKTRCLVKMQEITAKAMPRNSWIINKFMMKKSALREPTDNCDRMSFVITCFIIKFIRNFLFLSAFKEMNLTIYLILKYRQTIKYLWYWYVQQYLTYDTGSVRYLHSCWMSLSRRTRGGQ